MKAIYLFFLLVCNLALAQQTVDDYIKIIESSSTIEKQLDALDAVCRLTYNVDDKTFIKYSNELIDLAIKNKSYNLAVKTTSTLSSVYDKLKNDDTRILEIIDRVLVYKHLISTSNLGDVYSRKATYYSHNNDYVSAITYYTNSINSYSDKELLLKAQALVYRGQSYRITGDYVNAMKDYQKAIVYYESHDDIGILFVKSSLANLYLVNGFDKEGEETIESALSYGLKNIDKIKINILGNLYYTKAEFARKKNNYKVAEESLLEAEKYFKKANLGSSYLSAIYCGLAYFYAEKSDLEKANYYFELVDENLLKNSEQFLFHFNYSKICYETKKGNYKEVFKLLEVQKQISKKVNDVWRNSSIEKQFYEAYKAKKDYKKALVHYENFKKFSDSINTKDNRKTVLFYENLFESEQKDQKIKTNEANIELLKKENTIKNNLLTFGSIGVVCFLGIIYLLHRKRKLENSKKMQEQYAQNLILEQEIERKRIASELHDSVGQQLLLIKNQSILKNLENIKILANQTIEEVRSISMNLHPYQLEEFGLTKAIKMNLKKFEQSTDNFVSYEVDNVDHLFNETQEINIYRIIQECISNIVKHSKARASRVEVKKLENTIEIIVNDNGVGYNHVKAYNSKSLGLKTLKERANLLNGIMTINSEKNKGTKIEFIIPLKND